MNSPRTTGAETTGAETTGAEPAATERPRIKQFVIEALVGLAIALLLLWVAIAAVTDVPFVYQGL